MDDAPRVPVVNRLRHAPHEVRRRPLIDRRLLPGQPFRQVLTLAIRHHVVQKTVRLAGFVDGDDAGVVEPRHGGRLPQEAVIEVGPAGDLRPRDLEGHVPLQPRVVRPVDDAKPPAADLFLDRKAADSFGRAA